MSEIAVVVETTRDGIPETSLEALSYGRHLADGNSFTLSGVILDNPTHHYSSEVTRWADKVMAIKCPRMEQSPIETYRRALIQVISERKPALVLASHSSFATELLPSLAVAVKAPLVTDCIDLSVQTDVFTVARSIHNGKINAVYSLSRSGTSLVTLRPGVFPIRESAIGGSIEELEISETGAPEKFLEGYTEPETTGIDIAKEEVLVSVGRGIRDKTNIALAEELARLLGGTISCSRPVVDMGWLPAQCQVGLSGKTVKPKLYLALGISGSFQHMVGLSGAKMIIAINKDAGAPIFNAASYGIVGDVVKLAPLLIKEIKELNNNTPA